MKQECERLYFFVIVIYAEADGANRRVSDQGCRSDYVPSQERYGIFIGCGVNLPIGLIHITFNSQVESVFDGNDIL